MRQKVLVGYPCGGGVHPQFTKSLCDLQRFELLDQDARYEILPVEYEQGLYVMENRNRLVAKAREVGADWLLQIDTDEGFEPHLLRLLMDAALGLPAEIVFGLYANMQPAPAGIEGGFIFADMIFRELKNGAYENIVPPLDNRPFRVDAAGSGVLLAKVSAFDRIEFPYFWLEQILADGEDKPQVMNEDIAFCRKAREAGLSLWCEPKAEAKHFKTLPLLASPMRRFLSRAHQVQDEMVKL